MIRKINKKGVGEVFSWAIGLIFIVLIILIFLVFMYASRMGEKDPLKVLSSEDVYSTNLQRVAVYTLVKDFNSGEKGKLLFSIYDDTQIAMGAVVNFPEIGGLGNYVLSKYPLIQFSMVDKFYLPCKNCQSKYISIKAEVKNEK